MSSSGHLYITKKSCFTRFLLDILRPKCQRRDSESDGDSDSDLEALPSYAARAQRCGLFVSGLHNMALLALVDVSVADDPDVINSLVSNILRLT